MIPRFPILASDDALFKIIFWVIVGIIWAIASAVGAIKNKIKQAQARAAAGQLPLDLTPRMQVKHPPPLPRPRQQRAWEMNVPSALASPGLSGRQKKKSPRPPAIRVQQPPAPPRRSAVQTSPAPPMEPARSIQPTTTGAAVAAAASRGGGVRQAPTAAMLATILRPQSLRTQWILTEVLNKPIALRDDPPTTPLA